MNLRAGQQRRSMLLAVEAGRLGISGGEDPPIPAGSGIVSAAGSVREIRNAGDGLLDLLVLTAEVVAAVRDPSTWATPAATAILVLGQGAQFRESSL